MTMRKSLRTRVLDLLQQSCNYRKAGRHCVACEMDADRLVKFIKNEIKNSKV